MKSTLRPWLRRGITVAVAAGLALPVGAVPVAAAVELEHALVNASAEATDDGGSADCEKVITTTGECTATRSGSEDGASGSGSGSVTARLRYKDGSLVRITVGGSAGGRANPSKESEAYGEASSGLSVRFQVESPTVLTIDGTLRVVHKRAAACSALQVQGPNDAYRVQAPGSRCQGGVTDGTIDHTMTLQPGVWQLGVGAFGDASRDEGTSPANSRGYFDIDIRLYECDNEFTDGPDEIEGTNGDDTLCGGDGADEVDGKGGADRIFGGRGDDMLYGGGGADRIEGNEGIDLISGDGGNDTIRGGASDDIITGGDGHDDLFGDAGRDNVSGDAGNDLIDGGSGDDGDLALGLQGGPGNDTIRGGSGDDFIRGGSGDDALFGQDGRDKLRGESGKDRLTGGRGRDVLNGGSHRDDIRAKDGGRDSVIGGPGHDKARVDGSDQVSGVEVIS